MYRLLYTLLYSALTPLLFLRLLLKHQKSSAYKNERQPLRLAERLGIFRPPVWANQLHSRPIWIHTVSVGELVATLPLISKIMQQAPQLPLVITCTTTTGSAQISKRFAAEIKARRVFHVYLPYDLPGSMQRFLNKTRPGLGIVMETEIWPNMMYLAKQSNLPVWLLNARMSSRSAKGYARFQQLTQSTLRCFTGIAAQDALDAGRLKSLGAAEESLHITGSIKFDLTIDPNDRQEGKLMRELLNWQDKKVLIAASTHKGEDEQIFNVFKQLRQSHAELVLIIVPRHPERFQSVFQLLSQNEYELLRRSQMDQAWQQPVDILLGDSMGEMMKYYACSDMVFMGGTLIHQGGHNILEPAALGLPIIYGQHMFNFYAINELFLQYQASVQVKNEAELAQTLEQWLEQPQTAEALGKKAEKLMQQNSGALEKCLQLIRPYLSF
jgi:3-deoxy-D-manno-octulosonic-acid transferase